MKKYFLLYFFLLSGIKCFAQQQEDVKIAFISDERKKGILPYNCSTEGHTTGEVFIQWGMQLNHSTEKMKNRKDTVETYAIHFYKPDLNGILTKYQISFTEEGTAYDQGIYNWTNDTTVAVTLVVNNTEIKREITLFYSPSHPTWSAGTIWADDELLRKKKRK